ncbi:MAG: hypothetical protein HZA32_04060 [Opitutae bacterium]|nr:hypothetical protein [Opitutae bacterium]
MISNATGVFVFLTFDAIDGWESLRQLVSPELDRRGLKRLRPLLEPVCRSVVIERYYIDKDYRDTFSHFHSKRFNTPSARCVRLHFFAAPMSEAEIVAALPAVQEHYLGYAVIRPTKPNCLGRTLLSHQVRLEKSAHLSICEEQVQIMGTRLRVEGFPFISQGSDATVCAQSALWMLLRYYSNRYSWYSEILPFQITNLANQHAAGNRVYPSAGLYSWQLAEALRLQRFSPVIYSRKQYPAQFYHLLYTYIESGLPLLVTVPGHVVVCNGHASDYARRARGKKDKFEYSSFFNQSLVVSDDNDFPYQMLREPGPTAPHDSKYRWKQIDEFIVPLPEKVFLTADQAGRVIEILLRHAKTGIRTHSPLLAGKRLMLRLFLANSRSFKRRLEERGMGHPMVAQAYRNLPMPHFIWVCELADFDEYAKSKRVLGEVLWDATRNAHEPDGWIALHYPEKLMVDLGSPFNQPQAIKEFPLVGAISYSLFRSNLHSL